MYSSRGWEVQDLETASGEVAASKHGRSWKDKGGMHKRKRGAQVPCE